MNIQKYNSNLTTYILNTGEIAAGANKLMLDLFNNTANDSPPKDLILLEAYVTPKTDVAVTGVVSARFDFYRTSSIGTGGTKNAYNGSDPTVLNIASFDSKAFSIGLEDKITARQAPTSGATKAGWLFSEYAFPEETNSAAVTQQNVNILNAGDQTEPIVLHGGEGLLIQQGAVASLNSYIFTLVFALTQSRPYNGG